MTDNHWSYTHSQQLAALLHQLGTRHLLTKPHCPWQAWAYAAHPVLFGADLRHHRSASN
jgi:hypothetical protein